MQAGKINPAPETFRNFTGINPVTNNNSDKVILYLPHSDNTNLEFYSTKLVCDHCEITDRTFRKWKVKLEPVPEQEKNESGNRKSFRIDYLKKLFDNFAEKEVREKLETINNAGENLDQSSGPIPDDSENKITSLELALENLKSKDQTIESKNQIIEILKKQVDMTEKFWPELVRTQSELSRAQQKLEIAQNQLKLLENKPEKRQNWFQALLSRIKGE